MLRALFRKSLFGLFNAALAVSLIATFAVLNDRGGIIGERDILSIGRERLPARSPAQASQGSGCMPTVGTASGLTFANDVNAAIAALISSNSGASAPATDCSAVAIQGQIWLDTTSGQYKKLKYYDGTNWLVVGTLDATNHLAIEPIGGGSATIASAGTTDLWSTPEGSITVSGTTTVTQLASASAVPGTLKLVQFSGVLTLTYDATKLILPTTANITTAAGDYAVVLALSSTNVAIISYNRATGSALASSNGSVGASAFAASAIGMNAANNLQLNVSFASNNLTVAVKGVNGSDPSASNPVTVSFRDNTTSNGTEIFGQITAALSFTINSGNTMGTSSNVPARLWVELICQTQSGTTCTSVLLGASIQSTSTSCLPLVEGNTVNTGAGTNGGSAAGTMYTSAASLTGKAFRIAGWVELTESTAGTWASVTPLIHVFGPGDKKPCDVVQEIFSTFSTDETTTSTTYVASTNYRVSITPTSAADLVFVDARCLIFNGTAGQSTLARLSNGTSNNSGLFGSESAGNQNGTAGSQFNSVAVFGYNAPGSTSSVTYALQFKSSGATTAHLGESGVGMMVVREIQG